MSRILFEFFSTDYTDTALVGAAPVVFAPRVAAFIDPELAGAPGVSAPSVVSFLDPTLAGARAVFAPSFAAETFPEFIDPGVVGPGSAVFAPRVLALVDPALAGSAPIAFDLSIVSFVDPALSGSTPLAFAPELFDWGFTLRGADGVVYARLAEGGLAHAPLLLEALRVRWAPGGEASGDLLVGGEARVRYARGGSSPGRS